MDIGLIEQIAELKRELAMRTGAYPKFIAAGRLTPAMAERQMARMTAALHTLMALQQKATP